MIVSKPIRQLQWTNLKFFISTENMQNKIGRTETTIYQERGGGGYSSGANSSG